MWNRAQICEACEDGDCDATPVKGPAGPRCRDHAHERWTCRAPHPHTGLCGSPIRRWKKELRSFVLEVVCRESVRGMASHHWNLDLEASLLFPLAKSRGAIRSDPPRSGPIVSQVQGMQVRPVHVEHRRGSSTPMAAPTGVNAQLRAMVWCRWSVGDVDVAKSDDCKSLRVDRTAADEQWWCGASLGSVGVCVVRVWVCPDVKAAYVHSTVAHPCVLFLRAWCCALADAAVGRLRCITEALCCWGRVCIVSPVDVCACCAMCVHGRLLAEGNGWDTWQEYDKWASMEPGAA